MTEINSADLDKMMQGHVDPRAFENRRGVENGVMEGNFTVQTDKIVQSAEAESRGAPVVDSRETPGAFYGSQTIISLKEAPPLSDRQDPGAVKVVPAPAAPRSAVDLLRQMGLTKPKG